MEVFRFEQKTHAYLDYFANPIGFFFGRKTQSDSPLRNCSSLRTPDLNDLKANSKNIQCAYIVIFGGWKNVNYDLH